jgi:spermidine synthase
MLEFANVTAIDLNNYDEVNVFLTETIKQCKATIESQQHKIFEPQGLTILYLLSESHFSIHTWPEKKACAIDFYHCGDKSRANLTEAEIILCEKLGWQNCTGSMILDRGVTHQALLNHYDHSSTLFKGVKLIHREQTKYQDLRVYDTKEMGRCLSLDSMIQISDTLEDNYTVDLTRLVITADKTYDHILIIGAGDMIIPTYILNKYPGVKKVTLVEIDDRVVENTKKYFKFADQIDALAKEGRLEVVIEDGAKWLRERIVDGTKYDGLVIDNSDVYIFDGPAASLFTPEFYQNIYGVLKEGAMFSQQVSDENVKAKWESMSRSVGFNDFSYIYSNTPEYSVALPLGIAKK